MRCRRKFVDWKTACQIRCFWRRRRRFQRSGDSWMLVASLPGSVDDSRLKLGAGVQSEKRKESVSRLAALPCFQGIQVLTYTKTAPHTLQKNVPSMIQIRQQDWQRGRDCIRTLACPEDVPGKGLRVSIWVGVHPLKGIFFVFLNGARHWSYLEAANHPSTGPWSQYLWWFAPVNSAGKYAAHGMSLGISFLRLRRFAQTKKSPVVTMRDEDELLRTPEDAKRKCTDVVCLVVFLAIMGGLGYCIHQSVEAGDIQRLQSLPDYQGTQCSFLWKFLGTCWGTSFGLSAACITFEGVMTAKMNWNDRDA